MNTLLTWRSSSLVMWTSSRDEGAVGEQPVEQGVGHRLGLLVHLLAHVVVVAVLAGGIEVPVDGDGLGLAPRYRSASVTRSEPGRSSATWSSSSTKKSRVRPRMAGMSEARKAASPLYPHQQRRDPPGGHDEVGLIGAHHGQREGPAHPAPARSAPRRPDPESGRSASAASIRWASTSVSVSDSQVVPGGHQLVGQLHVVLDDPVVDHGQSGRAVDMGMGVALGGAAVGGPPGVADAGRRAGRGRPRPAWSGRRATGCRWPPGPATARRTAPDRPGRCRPSRSRGTRGGRGPRAGPPARRWGRRRPGLG